MRVELFHPIAEQDRIVNESVVSGRARSARSLLILTIALELALLDTYKHIDNTVNFISYYS